MTTVKGNTMSFVNEWQEFQKEAFSVASEHGFHKDDSEEPDIMNLQFEQRLMLIVGEVAEAHDDHRHGRGIQDVFIDSVTGKPEGIPTELADIVIRVADLAEAYGIDLGSIIEMKMKYNEGREHLHGRKF